MYKLLLSLRYLRTRFIALASIISVTLGVATMIVVNSVMSGFAYEMHQRLHGILSDIVMESHSLGGFTDVDRHLDEIRRLLGDDLDGVTTVVHVPAMLSFQIRGQWITRQVNLIGIDDATYARVSDFGKYLLHPENQRQVSFELREGGYGDRLPHEPGWTYRRARVAYERAYREQVEQMRAMEEAHARGAQPHVAYSPPRPELEGFRVVGAAAREPAGVQPASHTGSIIAGDEEFHFLDPPPADAPIKPPPFEAVLGPSGGDAPRFAGETSPPAERIAPPHLAAGNAPSAAAEGLAPQTPLPADSVGERAEAPYDPFSARRSVEPAHLFDEMNEQHTGIILGIALANVRHRDPSGEVQEFFLCLPGDDVNLTFPTAGTPPQVVSWTFTIVDLYESKMSEYDSGFAFVPLRKLQQLRGMVDPLTGEGAVTSIQIKLKPGAKLNEVRDRLRAAFPPERYPYRIQTWMEMQGPLLAAVQLETTILNILLFLIIAVAGFGILATFYMIVVEKTKDIGILKSLGAPSGGVMSIFLAYGLSLGVVGSGVGMVGGLLFVAHINEIAAVLEWITGREVFDPTVYYFQEIPTIICPFTIAWIVAGAMLIAVLASVLPALRAARLHPVEALRYE